MGEAVEDQGVAATPPGSQASPEAASASSPTVSIPNAALAPLPEPHRISAIALIAISRLRKDDYRKRLVGSVCAEIAARHGFLYGWYAALECAASLDAETLRLTAQAIEARRAATGTGAVEDESAVAESDAPKVSQP